MNPLTNIRSRQRQREQEVIQGLSEAASYHNDFKSSAYIYAGQLSFKLTEGDLLAIFSEYGELVDVNLVRDKQTKESRGFAFLAYEDQRSTDLAVDNLNGIAIDGRVIAVDHVKDYKRLVDNPDAVHQSDGGGPAAGGGVHSAVRDQAASSTAMQQRPDMAAPARVRDEPGGAAAAVFAPRGPSSLFDMLGEMEATIKAHKAGRGDEGAPLDHDAEDPMARSEARRGGRRSPSRHKEKGKHKHKHRKDGEHKGSGKRRERESERGGQQGREERTPQGEFRRRRHSPSIERR